MTDDREFWLQVRRGLLMVVAAIETRWSFPRTSNKTGELSTLGQRPASPDDPATQNSEPPRDAPLDFSQKGSG